MRQRNQRRRISALLLTIAVVAGACGSGGDDESAVISDAPTNDVDGAEAAAQIESTGQDLTLSELPGDETDPDADGGERGADGELSELVEWSPALMVPPCDLLDMDSVRTWVGDDASDPILLEHGQACGSRGPDDQRRIAVRVVAGGDDPHYLLAGQREAAQPVTDPADGWWLTGSPVAGSDELVLTIDDGAELVVEITDRTDAAEADRLQVATEIATAAFTQF